ncbi:MAG: DUF5074 domain-containing protein [Marinifilaceae bacterium]
MKLIKLFFSLLLGVCILGACQDDENVFQITHKVNIISNTGNFDVHVGDTLYLKADIGTIHDYEIEWQLEGHDPFNFPVFSFVANVPGEYKVQLTAMINGEKLQASEMITATAKPLPDPYLNGTFVLSEGVNGQVVSKLAFITDAGVITDSIYFKANAGFLGNLAQDLYINGGNVYIISQLGEYADKSIASDGAFLTVANAGTMVKVATYKDELAALELPTHVAVKSADNIYLRDSKGVWHFNPSGNGLTFIEGSEGAQQNRMVIANNKVYVPCGTKVLVIETTTNTIEGTIELPYFCAGIVKSTNSILWIGCGDDTNGNILKVKTADNSIEATHVMPRGINAEFTSTPAIAAKGDIIYYTNPGAYDGSEFHVYIHDFTTEENMQVGDASALVEDISVIYNGIGVHPRTGNLFMNLLKGWGAAYSTNHIAEFNFINNSMALKTDYKNYTSMPAGFFFTGAF